MFDHYPFAAESLRGFYERCQRGEKLDTPWINASDVEVTGNPDRAERSVQGDTVK